MLDNTALFSDAQAITADAGSTNVIDLGAAGTAFGHSAAVARDIGKATEILVTCNVVEALTLGMAPSGGVRAPGGSWLPVAVFDSSS